MTETAWENAETIFENDPIAELIDTIAGIVRGARSGNSSPAELLASLVEFARDELARQAALAPLMPAGRELLGAVLDDIAVRYAQRQATGEDAIGHKTGFPHLDHILGGLDRERMTILLAAPGAGKTTLSNQLAAHVAMHGAPVLYVSFENSPADLTLKQLAAIAGKSSSDIRRGRIAPDQLRDAWQSFRNGAGQRLYYLEGSGATSIETIRAALGQLQRDHPGPHPLVIIDYLQRLALTSPASGRGSGLDDMRGRVGNVAQSLRDLATQTGAHVWAISSTNRQAYDGDKSKPGLASARESGDIEFAADHVLTFAPAPIDAGSINMHTDPYHLVCVKNRVGETGRVDLARDKVTMRLAEVETRSTPQYAERARASAAAS